MSSRYLLTVFVTFGAVFLSLITVASSQEPLFVEDRELLDSIIAKVKASRTFETYFFETVWEYEKKGELTFIHSFVSRDQFGRFRCRQEFGTGKYTSDSEIDSWNLMICDGNVFASIAEIQLSEKHRAVVGKSPLRAMIFDTSEAASVPEPLEIGDFTTGLQSAFDSGSTVKLVAGSPEESELKIEYEGKGDYSGKGPPVYSAVIDLSQSSPVATVKENRSKSGELYLQSLIKYRDMGDGKMLPEFETLELFVGPKLKRTHRLVDARLNDPDDFPEETFDIDLPSGTTVWDKRHEVEYRLKSDQVINDKLDELALKAKAEQAGRPELAPSNLLMAQLVRGSETEPLRVLPQNSSKWTFMVIANLVILGVFSAFVIYKKRTSGKQGV